MTDYNKRWSILAAVRGNGLLIDGKRIYTFELCQEQMPTYALYWGVGYALLTEEESQLCLAQHETCPFSIGYRSIVQPTLATVSRVYLASRKAIFGEAPIVYLGIATAWRREPYSVHDMQEVMTVYHDWIETCISTSLSSKTSSESPAAIDQTGK